MSRILCRAWPHVPAGQLIAYLGWLRLLLPAGSLFTLETLEVDDHCHHRCRGISLTVAGRSRLPVSHLIGASKELYEQLRLDAAGGAILHTHGLWQMSGVYPAWVRRSVRSARLIHSPRGMLGLEALKISSWKKKLFWQLWQKKTLSDCRLSPCNRNIGVSRDSSCRSPQSCCCNTKWHRTTPTLFGYETTEFGSNTSVARTSSPKEESCRFTLGLGKAGGTSL